jgi:acetyltransferase-like isoleucine patch superfamily enzyme
VLSGEPFLSNIARLVDQRETSTVVRIPLHGCIEAKRCLQGGLFKQTVAAEWNDPRAGERQVIGHLGDGINVSAPFHCDYGYNLSIGDNVIIGPGCQLLGSGRIAIGRNTKISARGTISTLEEPAVTMSLERSKRTETAREVCIGENVHIGDGCIIKAGVCIGNNAIVRAGSIVIQASLHPYSFSTNL